MRTTLAAMMLTVLVAFWPAPAQAAPAWYVCEVKQAGMASAGVLIVQLTHVGGAFTNKFFVGRGGVQKEQLAALLTALAAGLNVHVNTDIALPGLPVLNTLYLRQ